MVAPTLSWRGREEHVMASCRNAQVKDRGASSVEYALLIALVAAVVVGGIVALGAGLPALFEVAFPGG